MFRNIKTKCNRLLTLAEVSDLTSLGKSTVLLWESQNKFPSAVRLSKTKRVWLEDDVDNWILQMHSKNIPTNLNNKTVLKEGKNVSY